MTLLQAIHGVTPGKATFWYGHLVWPRRLLHLCIHCLNRHASMVSRSENQRDSSGRASGMPAPVAWSDHVCAHPAGGAARACVSAARRLDQRHTEWAEAVLIAGLTTFVSASRRAA